MSWFSNLFSSTPIHDAAGGKGRRSLAWMPNNYGAVSAIALTSEELRIKSRDLVRRNAWANAGLEAFVANAVGTGIKPQSMAVDQATRTAIQNLWAAWVGEADATGVTDFYGLQSLACRAMAEGGECFIRIRPRLPTDNLVVPIQLQVLEAEHLPITLNSNLSNDNLVRSGIEFDSQGRRVAYHLYTAHPDDGYFSPEATLNALITTRVPANEIIHLYRALRPGQIRGEPWLSRALVKLNDIDKYDDAELVRKGFAASITAYITRLSPEDRLFGEGTSDTNGVALAGLEPGTIQILEPGEDIKFSEPADVGGSYAEFLRVQFRAVASAMGITYEQLTGDLTGVNYSSIRAGLLEFRRRMEAIQHGVLVHQFCRPVWNAWLDQAVLAGSIAAPDYTSNRQAYRAVKWIPQGWSWVDPEKEYKAMQLAMRSGLISRSEAVSAFGYDAEDTDREIAADNARADALGLVFDSDPRSGAQIPTNQTIETQPL